MKWKWILGVAVGILFIVLVALYVILLNFDFNYFKPQIAQAVKEATGRKLSMEGNIELAVGFTPALIVKNVGLANASWGSRSEIARIKRFEIQVSLLPLFRKIIEIERLVLIQPDILIETDNTGNSNLRFDTTTPRGTPESRDKASPSRKPFASYLFFKDIRVKNGRLSYKDGESGQTYDLTIDRAKAITGTDGPVSLDIKGSYNSHFLQVKGVLGPLSHIFDPDNPWHLKLTADTDEFSVTIDGSIKEPLTGKGLDIAVLAKGESHFTAELFNLLVLPDVGPFSLTAKINDPNGKLTIKDLDFSLGSDELARARITGGIEDLVAMQGMELGFSIQGNDLVKLEQVIGRLVPLEGSFLPDAGPFSLTAKLDNPKGKLTIKDLDFSLGSDELARARITGGIEDLVAMQGMELGFSIQGNDLVKLEQVIGRLVPLEGSFLPDAGPFSLTAKLDNPKGKLTIKDLDFSLGSDELARARITGGIEDLVAMQGMELGFSIQGDDLVKLEKVIGKPLSLKETFDISGHAVIPSLTYYKIDNMKASIGKSDFSGSLEINVSGEKPKITGELSSQTLDLSLLLPKKAPTESAKIHKKVFSDERYPLAELKQANVDVKIRAAQIILPSTTLNDLTANIILEDSHLTVKPLKFLMGGGTLDGQFELHPQGETTALVVRFKIVNSDLGKILEKFANKDIPEGKIDMDIDLKSQGRSVAELMAELNGQTILIMENGSINNNFINLLGSDLSSDLLKLLNPFKKETKFTEVNCLVSGFDISDGLAETTVLMLDTSQATVVGYGKINLDTEKLDLALKSSPKKGIGVKGLAKLSLSLGELTKPFKLGGTLANPSLSIDPKGTFFTIGKAVGGVALFGPVGLAAALASGKLGGKYPCVTAIEAVENINKTP